MKQKYIDLRATPLNLCGRIIDKIGRGEFANEYGDEIKDYSTSKSPLTNRLIKPYITSETHGPRVFYWLVDYIENNFKSGSKILDLGCGAGELMFDLSILYNIFGTTIHLGEVEYGRSIYGLADICPIDMRVIDDYFEDDYFDCIICHCSLHFIEQEERQHLVNNVIYKLLKRNGRLIIVDYKGHKSTGVDYITEDYRNITPIKYTTMGNLTVLVK